MVLELEGIFVCFIRKGLTNVYVSITLSYAEPLSYLSESGLGIFCVPNIILVAGHYMLVGKKDYSALFKVWFRFSMKIGYNMYFI